MRARTATGERCARAHAAPKAGLFVAVLAAALVAVAAAPRALAQTPENAASASAPPAASPDEIKNWYNDPFFALSNAVSACHEPLGPRMTKSEADDDAHYRVERGTTCWLAHKCARPNSYLYDADIAKSIRAKFKGGAALAGTSVWITVQRRFVYAEGCAPAAFDRAGLERRLSAIPDVEKVFVRLATDPRAPPPYKTPPPAR
jgi:hypothetical protein